MQNLCALTTATRERREKRNFQTSALPTIISAVVMTLQSSNYRFPKYKKKKKKKKKRKYTCKLHVWKKFTVDGRFRSIVRRVWNISSFNFNDRSGKREKRGGELDLTKDVSRTSNTNKFMQIPLKLDSVGNEISD